MPSQLIAYFRKPVQITNNFYYKLETNICGTLREKMRYATNALLF
jgi:hypothetical protein